MSSARIGASLAVALVLAAAAAEAATPEERCRSARYKAAGRYRACQASALAREVNPSTLVIGGMSPAYQRYAARCRLKHVAAWSRMQTALPGTAFCSGARLEATGSGTVTDKLTGLEWEQKTDDGGIHDKDDVYTWSASGSAADGTVFSTFLAALNGGCFAGHCDWRLPTMEELQTILDASSPCTTCVDPLFVPVAAQPHWTGSEDPDLDDLVRSVSFDAGNLNNAGRTGHLSVRAVRGGL